MRLIGLLFILVTCYGRIESEKVRYDNYKVFKITPKDAEALAFLNNLQKQQTDFSAYQFWSEAHLIDEQVDLMVAPSLQPKFQEDFKRFNLSYDTLIDNLQTIIEKENPSAITLNDDSWKPGDYNWTTYLTLDQINAWLQELVANNSDILSIVKPQGTTHEGREIIGVKLNVPGTATTPKKAVFVESNIHAREWITSAVSTYILDKFVNNRTTNETIRNLAEKYEWYWFPVMNPDGFVYSHTHDRLWRKTRTRYNVFCWGADPNRNWDYRWMEAGASQNPCTGIYAGPRPLSEPSVKIMADFISNIGNDLIGYIDFHSYSQLLMLPYGHTTDHLDNYDEMFRIGTAAVNKLAGRYGTFYKVGNVAEIIYEATGSSMDWVKATYRTPIVFTYELRDKGTYGFVLPSDQIEPSCKETLDSFITIFEEYENLETRKAQLLKN